MPLAFSVDIGIPQTMRTAEEARAVPSGRLPGFQLTRPVELTCFALCVANAVYLAASFVQGSWLIDPNGQAIATDFVNVWAGGRQALDGTPQAVYDVAAHKGAEDAALGHGFEGDIPGSIRRRSCSRRWRLRCCLTSPRS